MGRERILARAAAFAISLLAASIPALAGDGKSPLASQGTGSPPMAAPRQTTLNAAPVSALRTGTETSSSRLTDPAFRACGQDCFYQKGTEALSFWSIYSLNRLRLIKAAADKKDWSAVKTELGSFCLPSDSGDDGCYKRFYRAQMIGLYRLRNAILQNHENYAQLQDADRNVSRFESKDPQADLATMKAQMPYMPNLADLQKERKAQDDLLRQRVGIAANEWAQEYIASIDSAQNAAADPTYGWKSVPVDPRNPASDQMIVIEKAADGKKVLTKDQKLQLAEYLKAHKADLDNDKKAASAYATNPNGVGELIFDTSRVSPTSMSATAYEDTRKSFAQAVQSSIDNGQFRAPAQVPPLPGAASRSRPGSAKGGAVGGAYSRQIGASDAQSGGSAAPVVMPTPQAGSDVRDIYVVFPLSTMDQDLENLQGP